MVTPLQVLLLRLPRTSWDETALGSVVAYVRASRDLRVPDEWKGCLDCLL